MVPVEGSKHSHNTLILDESCGVVLGSTLKRTPMTQRRFTMYFQYRPWCLSR